ncbi:hypothetical protein DVA67_015950 [Solirubrobacter sp. CPCC 204708]|uniref:Uncharacterized protein n=1 Tax=Solirubrobacter deserti TaxID=2282478 RepID=A0ABT4RPC6_9ACTN|nr:hypothetical protein [Solirubrobacter deserti]MBE2317477.1 hypothetical protein [Solirubrobacter deserti]MDA0140345.1 hypothetical protein [Solirubrobacter deserti]
MPLRLIPALVAALALLPAAASAQEPTATPGPPNNASGAVKLIYEDYRRDGKIDVCEHDRADLQDAVDTIEPDFDTDYPDFREAVEAGITRHDNGRCDGSQQEEPTATATATASPSATPDDGLLPEPEQDSGGTDEGALPPTDDGTLPPEDGTLPPEDGAVTPAPTPVPSAIPPVAQAAPATPTPIPTPATVSTKADSGRLLIPAVLVALAIVGALALAFFGRDSAAMREATFRTRATWADFTDWLRLGR